MERSLVEWIVAAAIAVVVSLATSIGGYFNGTLSGSGACLWFFILSIHFLMGIRFGAVLLVFAVIWHVVSEAEEKNAKKAWNWIQVLAKSGIPTLLLCVLIYVNRLEDICFKRNQSPLVTYLVGAIIGHYAYCAGVTASSAIGTVGILINPRVPPVVTNSKGAAMLDGISIAALAGTVIGGTFSYITLFSFRCAFQDDLKQLLVTAIALVAGVVGFLIDSILVAVQEQRKRKLSGKVVLGEAGTEPKIGGWCWCFLNHNLAHLISSIVTALFTSLSFWVLFLVHAL